jgi:hypothetical protein
MHRGNLIVVCDVYVVDVLFGSWVWLVMLVRSQESGWRLSVVQLRSIASLISSEIPASVTAIKKLT